MVNSCTYHGQLLSSLEIGRRTLALAHNSRPPMGANMMPMAKKMGRTVLGVRIGLVEVSAAKQTRNVDERLTAMLSISVVEMLCL